MSVKSMHGLQCSATHVSAPTVKNEDNGRVNCAYPEPIATDKSVKGIIQQKLTGFKNRL